MPDPKAPVLLRMIASPADREAVLSRLSLLCGEQEMTYTVVQDEPYWKLPDRREVTLHLCGCPVWNYGQWSRVYRGLLQQDLSLEWEADESIRLYTYPAADSGALWACLLIPSACFWPKPSKDIKH